MNNQKFGILYIIATPIGNMGDITLRAIETLKNVDVVACEDTRVTGSLLHKLEIKRPMVALHQHSDDNVISELVDKMMEGEDVAYVTDGGTPAVSDPGTFLVKKVQEANRVAQAAVIARNEAIFNNKEIATLSHPTPLKLRGAGKGEWLLPAGRHGAMTETNQPINQLTNIKIIPIPGSSAVTAAVSVSGLIDKEFYFAGFLPKKKGRQTWLRNASLFHCPIVIYESAHRLEKTLNDLNEYLGEDCQIFLAREMTKMFEEYWGGNIVDVVSGLKNHKLKGEFVIIAKKMIKNNFCLIKQ